MLVATLEIARDNIDHYAPDFRGREAITRLIDSAVADSDRRVPR
jgi:spore cortex formation protein SpoVR/YcgB (stage V sporulation)